MTASSTTSATKHPARSRPGGRSAQVIAAVQAATLQLLLEKGYSAIEIPEIAERAGVNKTTVYRRWPSKAALFLDLALAHTQLEVPITDTGSLVQDLYLLLSAIHRMLQTPFATALLRALISAGSTEPEIQQARQHFWQQRFAIGSHIVQQAIARQELAADTEPRQLLEMAAAPLFFRVVITGGQMQDNEIKEITQRVIAAFKQSRQTLAE